MLNLKRHHVLYVLLALALAIGLLIVLFPRPSEDMSFMPQHTAGSTSVVAFITPDVQPMRFEIVTTPAAQELGLGKRSDIPENYGMLFVFSQEGNYGFWMKDMLTSIDMIWLSDTGTILKINASVAPSTYPEPFYPPQPVKYVLETRAGEAARRGWTIGSNVGLPLPYGK